MPSQKVAPPEAVADVQAGAAVVKEAEHSTEGVLSNEAVEAFASLMPALQEVIKELREMSDEKLREVGKKLGEERITLLKYTLVMLGDEEEEIKGMGVPRLLRRLVFKYDELTDEDKARIVAKQLELESNKKALSQQPAGQA